MRKKLSRPQGHFSDALAPDSELPLRAELFSPEQLERHSDSLSNAHRVAEKRRDEKLLPRLKANERMIDHTYDAVTEMIHAGIRVPPAGEWLLDNYYVIKEHISLAREHLPKHFSRELPLLETGAAAGFPRIYHLATELISHVDGRVDTGNLSSFIAGYQRTVDLTVGELWAIPIMLRLALIENLRRVAQRVIMARNDCVAAEKWAERLVFMAEKDPKNLVLVLADMVNANLPSSSAFVAELCRRLQGQSSALALALSWFEQRLAEQGVSSEQLILAESQGQASDQVSIGNTISSLRLLSATDWREFVERNSVMERILREDPAGIYSGMDFETRDLYRHIVERIAKKSKQPERDVAQRIVTLARESGGGGGASRKSHIGYYLIDKGLKEVERIFKQRIRTARPSVAAHLNGRLCGYLASLAALTALLTAPLVYGLVRSGVPLEWTVLLSALFAFCATEPALHLLNNFVVAFIPPQRLPQMDFSHGIPDSSRTVVVVPTMISCATGIDRLIEGLEIRYLANKDRNVYFALLTDFPDADRETLPDDQALVAHLQQSIEALNKKYAADRPLIFFLFHRPRLWNPQEGVWMGYERKRGKLTEFNRVLRDGRLERFSTVVCAPALLPTFKYVVTLDTDTRLPRNAVQRMAGAMAHPLNRPVIDATLGRVVDGYGVLQPRVGLNLSSARCSWFARLFAADAGIDPYTHAVSNVYQDLFGGGSFVGKGIYDVDAFEQTCGSCFPENRVLSHDLIEGCHARSGLLADVELFEDYPGRFNADARRRHRWIRGDWQIAGWLWPHVPRAGGKTARNPLSALSHWKIFDNLRRSAVPPCTLVLLALTWLCAPQVALPVTAGIAVLALLPAMGGILQELFARDAHVPLHLHLRAVAASSAREFWQALFSLGLLAFEALLSLHAIFQTEYRLNVSKRHLLEWQTASDSEQKAATTFLGVVREMRATLILTLVLVAAVFFLAPAAFPIAAPLLALWLLSPLGVHVISIQRSAQPKPLSADDRIFLREAARRTWRYFHEFISPEEHWLPPDNFQQTPQPAVASRTSPTNMGAGLLSTVAAFDFGYVALNTLVFRLQAMLQSMASLPRYQGHLFNWYDTRTLVPLNPHYISSVDSGNLLSYLLVLRAALDELPAARLLPPAQSGMEGLADTVRCLQRAIREASDSEDGAPAGQQFAEGASALLHQACLPAANLRERCAVLARFIDEALKLNALAESASPKSELAAWSAAVAGDARDMRENMLRFAPWLERAAVPQWLAGEESFTRFETDCSLHAAMALETQCLPLIDARLKGASAPSPERVELEQWREDIRAGAENARRTAGDIDALKKLCSELADMKFDFLFDRTRMLLAIGYNASDHRLDGSYYDLLASEARVASYVCIALGQLPAKHWFMLGRKLTTSAGEPALLSWSGSMFEYLMPSLIMPSYDGSLLDQTNQSIVQWQIDYARANHMPWGISESGFNARDMQQNYQYRAFGVPGLGFKRGLAEDLGVAPYASVMALMVAPEKACRNLRELARLGALGPYGFFEAIDYTPSRLMGAQKFAIVHSFMVHHQGMSMLGLAHRLLNQPMQRRFATNPELKAADLLLQERVPHATAPIYPHSAEEEHVYKKNEQAGARIREFKTANTPRPEVQLLSNGRYHVMLTNAGGGYSHWKDLAVTRWREDGTCDAWGQFCYIRDAESGALWSATHQPCLGEPDDYLVQYTHSSAEFRMEAHGITTHLAICVSPEDDAEIRILKLVNTTRQPRSIEVVTYAEVVLNSPSADMAHPAFGNLFVETEILPEKSAILGTRRPRESADAPPWMFHQMIVKGPPRGTISFETDRAKFIGRGRSPRNPEALQSNRPLSGSAGPVLDPMAGVRRTIRLAPSESVELELVTGIAENRQAALVLIDKFQDHRLCERAFEVAWTHNKVVLSQLNAAEADAQTYCEFAAPILHVSPAHRASTAILSRNQRGQSGLWGYGISGDFPIVLLRISDIAALDLARETVQAHAYLRMKGTAFDLVIWYEDTSNYRQALHDALMGLVLTGPEAGMLDRPSGIFIRRGDLVAEDDRVLLQALARVTLQEGRGHLPEQIERHVFSESRQPRLVPSRLAIPVAARPAAVPNALKFFNGIGGFSPRGHEYDILLNNNQVTPAPWCNVIANAEFGTVISENGSAYSWAGNAHEYRLTPWNNDALIDSGGECLYLRDDESGAFWSPAPKPACGGGDYRIRHGFGYSIFETANFGIRSELTVFVAPDAPVKFMLLKIRNENAQRVRVTATAYWEWVLGENRTKNAQHIVTELDNRNGAIYARNAYNTDFKNCVSFCSASERTRSTTCDRTEFIGRNGTLESPAAMRRTRLSGRVGAGLDPCTALQVAAEIHPGEERVLVFVLGTGKNAAEAQNLSQRYRSVESARQALERVNQQWGRTLGALQIETPDPALDVLANGWLPYQVLACRVWARSGFYQSGGAYGFRDQLQDTMALIHAAPELAREHLLRCAGRQFEEGDVQHWWHPPTGRGVRTKFSDDFLWLPYAVARYVLATGDTGVLSESAHFVVGRALKPAGEEAYYDLPQQSDKSLTLYEHCKRALNHALGKMGRHGLPLMGCGDWNDGMNLVGIHGEGESVWLAFFLYDVLQQFGAVAKRMGDAATRAICEDGAQKLRENIHASAWDGKWYLRAFFDDGKPLGSSTNQECRIDSLPQSWAVLSKAGEPERDQQAMDAVEKHLVHTDRHIIQLFDPPFDKSELNPGYIKAYVPGVRENGGQYTHAAIWTLMAFAELGEIERAWELLRMLNPINHGATEADIGRYKVEPYVMAADVYGVDPLTGRGGWTWYTGSAGWMYRLIVESLLGVRREVDMLSIRPRVPKSWKRFGLRYRFRETPYRISVERADKPSITVDGEIQTGETDRVRLVDDRREHVVVVKFAAQDHAAPVRAEETALLETQVV